MKDNIFENRLKDKIKREDTAFPSKLDEKIKVVISELPERHEKSLLWARYGRLAVSLALLLCVFAVGITSLNLKEGSIKNNPYIYDNEKTGKKVADNTDNSAIEKLKSEGYIVENKSNDEKDIKIVSSTADTAKVSYLYRNLEELAKDSDIVIEGKVLGISFFDHNTITWTKSKVKVIKSYNKNVKEEDILTFVETGGITTQYNIIKYSHIDEKFNMPNEELEKARSEKIKVLNLGAPYMQPNEKVFLFAKDDTDFFESTTEKYYSIMGGFQGKFTVLGGTAERYVPQGDRDMLPSLKMSEKDMHKRIEEIVANK